MRILFIFRAPLVSPRSEEVTRTELGGKQTFCSLRLGLGSQLTFQVDTIWTGPALRLGVESEISQAIPIPGTKKEKRLLSVI